MTPRRAGRMIASFRSAETLDIPERRKAMRKAFIIALVVLAASMARSVSMDACGDKFLQVGRGAKFRAYAAIYPASILIYTHGAPGAKLRDRKSTRLNSVTVKSRMPSS